MITTQQQQRADQTFSDIAGEPVEVEFYDSEMTVFCSELGMYRIADKYTKVISKGYSKNLETWFITVAR